jgi:leukotriene-A4 hydrolase
MKNVLYFAFALLLWTSNSCDGPPKGENKSTINPAGLADAHSYANVDVIRTKHLHLDLDVNFENNTIYGVARHEMVNSGTDTAIFDIKGLEIQKVTLGNENEKETDFLIGQFDKDSVLGQPLMVTVEKDTRFVNIYYKTTEKSEALDWLSPELTSGKQHPFLYTQGQAILTRTWIPVQDTPSSRITYSAKIKVPEQLLPIMSASNPTAKNAEGIYQFEMKQAIPCYLIALAVGDLTYRKLGKNCGVYSEPELIEQCAYEFVDLPKMMQAAESLYGKYLWDQYDLIVLPYSFPFGGMENPRLTFLNPTILAGDRSLVSVVAHELAHSWSGNLVTNSSWNDFWLNEGFTVYFENRIMEQLYGKEISDMLLMIERQELDVEIEDMMNGQYPEDTKLKLTLDSRNPDDGMTSIAYVKGALFLKTLEQQSGRKKMDNFLRAYFNEFAFKTITTEQFLDYLNVNLLEKYSIRFNADEWIYQEGLPENCVAINSKRFKDIELLADRFAAGEDIFKKTVKYVKVKGRKNKKKVIEQLTRDKYITQEWQGFIRRLPKDISAERMKELDAHLNFRDWGNTEIMTEWYVLGINNQYEELKPSIERFLIKIGRRKYLMPIYKALAKRPTDKQWARNVFNSTKQNYHAVSRNTVQEILYSK